MFPAYEILADPEKRKKYDRFGESAFDGSQGGTAYETHFSFDDFFKDFDSFFEMGGDGHQHRNHGHSFFTEDDEMDMGGGQFNSFFGGFEDNSFEEFDDYNFGHNQFQHFESHHYSHMEGGRGQRCQTVTEVVGNMVSTHTVCS